MNSIRKILQKKVTKIIPYGLTLLGLCLLNKLSKAAFTTSASIRMLSHENPPSTPWAISFFPYKFVVGHFVKLKNLCLSAFFLICIFQTDPPYPILINPIYSYLFFLPDLEDSNAACLAFNFAAFSSSIIFFLSAFPSKRKFLCLGRESFIAASLS